MTEDPPLKHLIARSSPRLRAAAGAEPAEPDAEPRGEAEETGDAKAPAPRPR